MTLLLTQVRLILRNDLRLLWRHFRASRWSVFGRTAVLAVLFVALHAVSILLCLAVGVLPPLYIDSLIWSLFGFMMLGTAMNQAIALLFERSDFDLLLSSPVDARAVLLARIFAITASAFLSVALLLAPLLNGAIIGLSWSYLAGYVVWILLAATFAAIGITFTLSLVRWLGARQARIWIQITAGVLSALVYLAFQARNYIPHTELGEYQEKLDAVLHAPVFQIISHAGRGEPKSLALLLCITLLVLALSTRQLSRTFLHGVQESNVAPSQKKPIGPYAFTGNLSLVTFFKDIRLIVREPLLLSQILPSLMYIAPVFFGFHRYGGMLMLAPVSVVIAVQFSALLAAVASSGEEGLDLIRMSPSSELQLRRAKMAAGMVVPLTLCLIICTVVACIGHPWLALIAFSTSLACAAAAAWLEVATIRPSPRKDVLRRPQRSGHGVVAAVLLISGGAGVGLIAYGATWIFGLLALGVTALIVIGCFVLVDLKEFTSETGS